MIRITSITCALVLSACALETVDESVATQAAGAGCPTWGCNENSPIMGPYGDWWELNVNGALNNQNLKVLSFVKGVVEYQPVIKGSQLYATHPTLPTLSGTNLTNGYFKIRAPDGFYQLQIAHVNVRTSSNVTFWLGPPSQIETYELRWQGPNGTSGRVCANPPPEDGLDGGSWPARIEAFLFTGDRYDAGSKRVTQSDYASTSGWFNIGCAGSVLAKLHLNRHTTAGSTTGYTTKWEERQTLLKMYVSDVCGTGNAWTLPGTPLHFELANGWSQLSGLEDAVEAQWGPNGVVCWNERHRLGLSLLADIENDCGWTPTNKPVSCDQVPTDFVHAAPFLRDAYVVSAVPTWVP